LTEILQDLESDYTEKKQLETSSHNAGYDELPIDKEKLMQYFNRYYGKTKDTTLYTTDLKTLKANLGRD